MKWEKYKGIRKEEMKWEKYKGIRKEWDEVREI